MTATAHADRSSRAPAGRRLRRWWHRTARRYHEAEIGVVLLLSVVSVVIGAGLLVELPGVTVSALSIPMVLGSLLLGPRTLPWFVVFVLGVEVMALATMDGAQLDARRLGAVMVTFLIGLIILVGSFRRVRLGVAGSRGESMLVDLRDRISKQARLPSLPADWYAESVMRSAGGSSFAGDFLVSTKGDADRLLQVVVVDVSGKGEQAGTRALLLSGAFGGLLGALPPERFLPAANAYLLRQDWEEGFATAVHLSVDLTTGDFELRSAGHPPAVQLHAGSGRWAVHETEGPILGLIDEAEFVPVRGRIVRGDALMMFTDGLVETPQRDISSGIDKLLGHGERMLREGFEHGARRLVDGTKTVNDDRALMLLHRR